MAVPKRRKKRPQTAAREFPPPVTPEHARNMGPTLYARVRWLRENPTYDNDRIAGPAPHPQPCTVNEPVEGRQFSCEGCARWRIAVRRGMHPRELVYVPKPLL